ncbi:TPA: hypothetical protein QCU06_005905 [Bacillus cereus]|nr:hypothetical protein [Bacillus cereus]
MPPKLQSHQVFFGFLYCAFCTIVQGKTVILFGISIPVLLLPLPVLFFFCYPKAGKSLVLYLVNLLIMFFNWLTKILTAIRNRLLSIDTL